MSSSIQEMKTGNNWLFIVQLSTYGAECAKLQKINWTIDRVSIFFVKKFYVLNA